ncbi:MAG: hypothetical protein H6745_33335 [Deltaproteobacteria bacterium]|nr:hypothetical protein [Deltaproteobacteria bacterium]
MPRPRPRLLLARLALFAMAGAVPASAHGAPGDPGGGAVSAPVGGTSTVRIEPILRPRQGAMPEIVAPRAVDAPEPVAEPVVAAARVAPAAKRPRGHVVTLRRATDCRPEKRRSLKLRAAVVCHGEERATVDLAAEAPALELAPAAPRLGKARDLVVPSELAQVYRVCPYAPDPTLDAHPELFIPYEDRDVGRCYVWAPLDGDALASAGKYDRRDYLATIHPFMRAVILRAIAESAADGHRFFVISGTRPAGKPSWHTFGLAVDVQIAGRRGLKEATRAYLAGGAEHDAWVAFAETCERLGLYWLGRRDADEIFHFEWRPGWTGLPHDEVAAGLADDLARGGLDAVWARLRYDGRRPTALKALRDAPAR